VTSVQQVADIMNEIASASQEQSSGIAQVNTTIVTMDTATQQNAALVEEAAAAAASMREQAQRLVAAIAVFRIDERATAPVYAATAHAASHALPASMPPPASKVAHPPHPKLTARTPVQPRTGAGKSAGTGTANTRPAPKGPEGDDWEEF
jgi:DNA polymerase III gamma/tau subunit